MAERKSIFHGATTDGHGPDEHGLGALASPDDPRDFAVAEHPGYAAALAGTFPSAWLEPNTPPISNQGATPMCVAYSNANDQGHMDRAESGGEVAAVVTRGWEPRSPTGRIPVDVDSFCRTCDIIVHGRSHNVTNGRFRGHGREPRCRRSEHASCLSMAAQGLAVRVRKAPTDRAVPNIERCDLSLGPTSSRAVAANARPSATPGSSTRRT